MKVREVKNLWKHFNYSKENNPNKFVPFGLEVK